MSSSVIKRSILVVFISFALLFSSSITLASDGAIDNQSTSVSSLNEVAGNNGIVSDSTDVGNSDDSSGEDASEGLANEGISDDSSESSENEGASDEGSVSESSENDEASDEGSVSEGSENDEVSNEEEGLENEEPLELMFIVDEPTLGAIQIIDQARAGSRFVLYNINEEIVAQLSNGELLIEGLAPGQYGLLEILNNGFEIIDLVEVMSGETSVYTTKILPVSGESI